MAGRGTIVEVDDLRDMFRPASSYLGRSWRNVGRELGLSEEDLGSITANNPMCRASDLAYHCLNTWRERYGKTATKDQLLRALQKCNQHKAEESISNMTVRIRKGGGGGSLRRKTSAASRTRPVSDIGARTRAVPTPPPQLPSEPRNNHNSSQQNPSHIDRAKHNFSPTPPVALPSVSTRPTSIQRRKSAPPRHPVSRQRGSRSLGELSVKVEVSSLDMECTDDVSWVNICQDKILLYYNLVLRHHRAHIKTLAKLPELDGITIKRIKNGSLIITVQCSTLSALNKLESLCETNKLGEIFAKVLVTNAMLRELEVDDIELKARIKPEDLERCRQELMLSPETEKMSLNNNDVTSCVDKNVSSARMAMRQVSHNGTSPCSRRSPREPVVTVTTPTAPHYVGEKRNLDRLGECNEMVKVKLAHSRERFHTLQENIGAFLYTLEVSKPIELRVVRTTGQLASCLEYLHARRSMGRHTGNADMLSEFLAIVDAIRSVLDCIQITLSNVEGVCTSPHRKEIYDKLMAKTAVTKTMLEPSFDLSGLTLDLPMSLGILEARTFGGLICYIPTLLQALDEILHWMAELKFRG